MTKIRDRDQIIDVAAQLFRAKGYEATSLDDIADDLGTARSALYYHVSGKAELRTLVQIKRVKMLVDEARCIADSGRAPAEKLGDLVRAQVRHFERFYPESKLWSFITTEALVTDASSEALHEQQKLVEHFIRQVIAEGVQSGDFATSDVAVAALATIGMCHYLTTWYRPEGRLSIEQIGETFARMAVGALRV